MTHVIFIIVTSQSIQTRGSFIIFSIREVIVMNKKGEKKSFTIECQTISLRNLSLTLIGQSTDIESLDLHLL